MFFDPEGEREKEGVKNTYRTYADKFLPFSLNNKSYKVMYNTLNKEKMIPLFCYNVPVLAVLYKINRSVFIADGFIFILL